MNNHDFSNKNILELKDEVFFVTKIYYIIGGLIGVISVKLPVIFEVSQTQNQIAHLVSGGAIFIGIFGVISYLRDKDSKIKFSEKSINKNLDILNIDDIKEVYRVSFLFTLETEYGIRRFNLLSKFILILISPFLTLLYILNVIFKKVYYREKVLHDLLVIVGKNDKQVIWVQLPLQNKEEQKKLENYCKKYLGRDITSLKTKFFIPNNEKWFIQS